MREFLYLNSDLVDQFLSQEEDGLYDEQEERERRSGDRKGGGSIGASGAKVEASLTKGQETEYLRTRRQTPESRFNRLMDLVEEMPDSKHIEVDESSQNVFGQAKAGRLITAECYVDIPSIGRTLAQPDELRGMLDLMRLFAPGDIPAEDNEVLDGISAMSERMGDQVICTGEIDDDLPTLVFKIPKKFLRVPLEELEGEVTVFGNINRKWPEGERYPVLAVPGLNLISRADRRRMAAQNRGSQDDEMHIEGPGITVSVVGIYRGG